MKPKVLALTGCTASGKSGLAMKLAREYPMEIVCMDSMQIYRRMDIGTAKPTRSEQKQVPHHMLDILEPEESYAVARYVEDAERVFADIWQRGKIPLLVGGTGLYLKSLLHGMTLGQQESDPAVRARYAAIAAEPDGKIKLHALLEKVDEETARRLHPNDLRRVVRALEVYELTGTPMSRQKRQEPERPYDLLPMALRMPRPELQTRIAQRVQEMMRQGLLREVQGLLDSGVPAESQSMQAIGYKELVPVCRGQVAEADAVWQIILNTRHYAKRQETWFRAEEAIRWVDAGPSAPDELRRMIDGFWQM